jgi:hypothetical protein
LDIFEKRMNRRLNGLLLVFFLTACGTGTVEVGIAPIPTYTLPPTAFWFPTFTPVVSDTPASTLSPSLSPTTTSSPTATATSSPTIAAGREPSATQGLVDFPSGTPASSRGPCENVLFPLSAGRQWKYELTHEGVQAAALVSVLSVEGNAASVDLLNQSNGAHSSFTVHCDGEALTDFTSVEIGFLFFSADSALKAHSTSGLLAPSTQDFENHDWDLAWKTGLLASGRLFLTHPSLGDVELAFQDAPVQIDWRTAGAGSQAFESVTSPAGTFPKALKILAQAHFDLMVELRLGTQNQLVPAVLELVSVLWYQPHVGLVRQAFISSQVFIAGQTFPADITSQMELLEYSFSV